MTDHTDRLISRRAVVSIVTGFVVVIVLAVLTSPIGRNPSARIGMDQGPTSDLPASTAQPAPGETGLGDSLFPELGNSGYDVQHYDLDLRWKPEGDQLSGTARIDLTATAQLSSFSLDLSGLIASSVTVAGVDATFLAEKEELIITPKKPLDKGSGVKVVVAYAGSPEPRQSPFGADIGWMLSDDGVIVASEPDGSRGWFPCNDHPSDKATFRISMSVPAGLMVVSNGELESHSSDAAGSTWVWHEESPMAPYLATANIGKFDIAEGKTTAGVPIYVAVDPKTDVDPKQQVALVKKVIDFQVSVFGPYPFDSVGGIYEYGNLGYALETQTKPIYPSDVLDDSIVVHELAHQWFGDSVSVQDWRDIWLNEGFATYAEWMYAADNDVVAITKIFDKLYERGPGFWRQPPGSPTVEGLFGGPVYLRGAMTVHAIRLTIGEIAFADLLKAWTSTYADGNATTTDLFELTKTLSAVPIGKLFESWLYTPGRPQHP